MSQSAIKFQRSFSDRSPPETAERESDIASSQFSADAAAPVETATVATIAPYGSAYALSSRRAARINAAHAFKELDKWMTERKTLLDQLFAGSITAEERRRLRYVRWNIDRIQDARNGEILDVIESFVVKYEQFRDDLADFQRQLELSRSRKR